jgi:hypothetical protein
LTPKIVTRQQDIAHLHRVNDTYTTVTTVVTTNVKEKSIPLQHTPTVTMLASSSRILLRTAAGIGGRVAARALAARVASSSFPTSHEVRKKIGSAECQ